MDIDKINKIVGYLKFANSVADTVVHVESTGASNPGVQKFEEVNGRIKNALLISKQFDADLDKDNEVEHLLGITPVLVELSVSLFNKIGRFAKKVKEEIQDEQSIFERFFGSKDDSVEEMSVGTQEEQAPPPQ